MRGVAVEASPLCRVLERAGKLDKLAEVRKVAEMVNIMSVRQKRQLGLGHAVQCARELVRDEKCEVNGRWENRGYLLKTNDFIEIEVDRARQTSMQPEPIPIEIIYEDAEFLVVNKPSGMLVHPTVKIRTGTLLNALALDADRYTLDKLEPMLQR